MPGFAFRGLDAETAPKTADLSGTVKVHHLVSAAKCRKALAKCTATKSAPGK